MPRPVKSNQRYMPGLDGLRAIAVLGVIAYHLNFGWAPGGLLGVGVSGLAGPGRTHPAAESRTEAAQGSLAIEV